MPGPSPRLKFSGLLVALALLLASCDRCGDWIKSEGAAVPLACKGDGPKPQ